MELMNKITYIIPCYNEAEVIREFYRRISEVSQNLNEHSCEYIFVNDGSFDDTAIILNEFAESDDRVKELRGRWFLRLITIMLNEAIDPRRLGRHMPRQARMKRYRVNT